MSSENIIKSPNDQKLYKAIKLENGIQCILISEMHCNDNEDKTRVSLENKLHQFNQNILGIGNKELEKNSKCERPKSKQRNPKHKNGCDCEDVVAGVCLSVGAGSYHETGEVEGLAHLTEHMVFSGSKKYPGAKVFDEFVITNGGPMINGETFGYETCFGFGICLEQLPQAFDMFSHLFIDPDMTIEYLQNERTVVDAEFKMKNSALTQRNVFLQQLGTKGHPATRFSWGNSETLHTKDGNDQTLLKLVEQFRKLYYRTETMILTVHASETLEKLEEHVRYYFGRIQWSTSSSSPPRQNASIPFPYNNPEFKNFYYIHSEERMMLHVAWELPIKLSKEDTVKPLNYLSRVISKPDKGGLANYLKERNLALGIECKEGNGDYDLYGNFRFFHITFVLLEDSRKTLRGILRALFAYIKFLVDTKPQLWFFQEQQYINSLEFHFFNDYVAVDNAQTMALNVRRYGYENALVGPTVATKYDPKLIEKITQLLVPENANIICATDLSEDEKESIKIEPYFKTPYIISNINEKFLKELQEIKPSNNQFKFFEPNAYLTTKFQSNKAVDQGNSAELITIGTGKEDDKRVVMFHRFNEWMTERAEYRFLFRSPFPGSALQWEALLGIWNRVLRRIFISNFGGAMEAHIKITTHATPTFGFFVSVKGFFEKLSALTTELLKCISSMNQFADKDMFEACKFTAMKEYEVKMIEPNMLVNDLFESVTHEKHWTMLQLSKTLRNTEFPQFQEFCKKFVQSFFIIGFTVGKIPLKIAQEIRNNALEIFDLQNNNWRNVPASVPNLYLPLGETILRARSFGKSNKNAIYTYYQIPDISAKSKAICQIIEKIMEAPAFEYFRNIHSLGYSVGVSSIIDSESQIGAIYLVFMIQSHSDKFTGNHIQTIVDRFVRFFYSNKIAILDAKSLRCIKENVHPTDMDQANIFKHIIKNDMDFEKFEQEGKIIDSIKRPEIRKWYQEYLLPTPERENTGEKSNMRKLCCQVVGEADKEFPLAKKQEDFPGKSTSSSTNNNTNPKDPKCSGGDSKFQLTLLSPKECKQKINVVKDIETFKQELWGLPSSECQHYIP